MAPDLQILEVSLRNLHGPLPPAAVRAHAINGLFHAELARRYPELVEELHRSGRPMPFSLAPLFTPSEFLGFRVGTLTAEFGSRTAEVWNSLAAREAEIRLGNAQLVVQQVRPGFPAATTYVALLAEAPARHGVRLRFETPLRLKRYGRVDMLPAPRSVWQSYVNKWDAFAAGTALPPEMVRWADVCVQATELMLETRFIYAENAVEWKGVMGEVEYQAFTDDAGVPAERVPDYLRAWQALALLAEFCGTGEKTTMGMGRTTVVKAFGVHR